MLKSTMLIRLGLALLCFFLTTTVFAAVPTTISYQGVLTDNSGNPITNPSQSMSFSLYDAATGGILQWSESQTVNVQNGLYAVQLGTVNPMNVGQFVYNELWLEVSVGGEVLAGRQKLDSVPYALVASTAGSVEGYTATQLNQSAHLTDTANPHNVTAAQIGAATATALSAHTGDTGNPHGVTAAQTGAVAKSGDTMTGRLTINDATAGPILAGSGGGLTINGTGPVWNFGTSTFDPGVAGAIPATGAGTRMMWYPEMAAFRAGGVAGTQWDDTNIGPWSVATGRDTTASGSYSTAMGSSTTASGYGSTAMGWNTIARSLDEVAIGTANTNYTPAGGTSAWNSNDRLLVVGNGTSTANHSDALVILKNGHTGIGTSTPETTLQVAGGNWDLSTTEGDFKIGDATNRLKVGVATGGSGAGHARIYAEGTNPKLSLGAGGAAILDLDGPSGSATFTGDLTFSTGKDHSINLPDSTASLFIGGGTTQPWSLWLQSASYLAFKTSGAERLRVTSNGNVGIGTTNPAGKLDVNGAIYQRGGSLHADYVFESDYQLESIEDHEQFMWQNRHLKAIPKAQTDDQGREIIEAGAHRRGIVEELEKAHIYISRLNRRINDQAAKIAELEQEKSATLARLEKLEKMTQQLAGLQSGLSDNVAMLQPVAAEN